MGILSKKGIEYPTPIQEAAMQLVHKGHSLSLHAETGSGKTLALLCPLLLRIGVNAVADDCRVLILAPSRELAAQLAAEARALLAKEAGSVRLICAGEQFVPSVESLRDAAVIVATPVEFGEYLSADQSLTEWLPTALGALVLDEVDVLIPSKKFTGKRVLFMDEGMHPAEGLVKYLCRRNARPDFQVLAASASLDSATQKKLTRLLRASPILRVTSVPLPVITAPHGRGGAANAASGGRTLIGSSVSPSKSHPGSKESKGAERTTLVPSEIEHFTVSMVKLPSSGQAEAHDPLELLSRAADELQELRTRGASSQGPLASSASRPPIGLVILCSSLPLKVRVVTRELKRLGFRDVVSLGDALWPETTRALKGKRARPTTSFLKDRKKKKKKMAVEVDGQSQEGVGDANSLEVESPPGGPASASDSESSSLKHRAKLIRALKDDPHQVSQPSPATGGGQGGDQESNQQRMKLVVTDQFRTRGLHLDNVEAVFILGAAANSDTYLHLAGRTGRWPRAENGGAVVTIAPEKDLRKLRTWSAALGGVKFHALSFPSSRPEG